ncbi:uncharacterized protein LOC124406380 [Diprion similis]|uniref:uncharacterized protein LOC124406380 n=1 Tax=Diprion similis TaxID=362088 RepID=UPI001EF8631E|nr:uncharacterized protein LOC124406380 [Diprion similis]
MFKKNNLNGGNYGAKIPRYEELAIPRIRVDSTSKHEPFKALSSSPHKEKSIRDFLTIYTQVMQQYVSHRECHQEYNVQRFDSSFKLKFFFHKYKKKTTERVKRYKRLLELAKPKSIASQDRRNSSTSLKRIKKSRFKNRSPLKLFNSVKALDATEYMKCETLPTKKSVLGYKISERTARLAEPRVRFEMGIRSPGTVQESALFATASKRLVELATPKNSTQRTNLPQEKSPEIISNSGVSRNALRATCTPRISKLSAPKCSKSPTNDNENTKANHGDTTAVPIKPSPAKEASEKQGYKKRFVLHGETK